MSRDVLIDDIPDFRYEDPLLFLQGIELLLDPAVILGIHRLETQILERLLELEHTEPVCDRGVDVQRLQCDPLALGRIGMESYGTHVIDAIRKLDEDDPHILADRDEHLPEASDHPLLSTVFELRELLHSPGDVGDILSEYGSQILHGAIGILGDIMQEAGLDGNDVGFESEQLLRCFYGVDDVRVPGFPELSVMRLLGEDISLGDCIPDGFGRYVAHIGNRLRSDLLDHRIDLRVIDFRNRLCLEFVHLNQLNY